MAKNTRPKDKAEAYGFWRMVRDVLIASMNKGQLPAAGFVLVLLSLIWRMPPNDVSKLVFKLLDDLESWRLAGWIVAVISLCSWAVHARLQRRIITSEMRRIGKARSEAQERSIPGQVKSSERR